MTADFQNFVHKTPTLGRLLNGVEEACRARNPDALRGTLLMPHEVKGDEQQQFFRLLQQELRATCPEGSEGMLHKALQHASISGWVSILPVMMDYLRFIRDWTKPENDYQDRQLKKLTDDVSDEQIRFYLLMSLDILSHQ